jgi:hypothetical protein
LALQAWIGLVPSRTAMQNPYLTVFDGLTCPKSTCTCKVGTEAHIATHGHTRTCVISPKAGQRSQLEPLAD